MNQPALPQTNVIVQQTPQSTNVLGVIGFVLVLLGALGICVPPLALAIPIGTFLALLGMFREPRGLAIAGFIIGLLFSVPLLIVFLFFGVMGLGAAAMGSGDLAKHAAAVQGTEAIYRMVTDFQTEQGRLPATLDELQNLGKEAQTDPWGRPYVYEVQEGQDPFRVVSSGPDGIVGNTDDVTGRR